MPFHTKREQAKRGTARGTKGRIVRRVGKKPLQKKPFRRKGGK